MWRLERRTAPTFFPVANQPLQQHMDSKPDMPIAHIAAAGRLRDLLCKKIDCGNVARYPCETYLINCIGDYYDR
jgi:hypothetical protein